MHSPIKCIFFLLLISGVYSLNASTSSLSSVKRMQDISKTDISFNIAVHNKLQKESTDNSSTSMPAKLVKHPFLLSITLITFFLTVCIMSACVCLHRADRGHEEVNLTSLSVYKDAQEDLRKYISSIYDMKKPNISKVSKLQDCKSRRSELKVPSQVPLLEPKSQNYSQSNSRFK